MPVYPVISGTVAGLRILLPDLGTIASLERRILERKSFQLKDVFLRSWMGGPGAYLDIGANVGLTCLPHAVLQDFSIIIAIEPETRNFECLKRFS